MSPSPFVVSVPATSANLGPGFDAVGVALGLSLRARVAPASRFSLHVSGPHAPTHGAYARAIRHAIAFRYGALRKVAVRVENDIPLGKGLGSSAAAAVLGLAIARRCAGEQLDRAALAADAASLEGHADNAYAAVFGGAVIAASSVHVKVRAPHRLRAVIVVPNISLSTTESRSLPPDLYSRADASFNAARASLLGAALASGSWKALGEAMRDRLHQPYRASRIPGLEQALALHERGLIGVALSGAGPSVIAITRACAAARIGARIRACFSAHGIDADVLDLSFAARGAAVRGA